MYMYFLARIETKLLPLAKKTNSIATSSKLCKIIEHPLSSNKSLAIEKTYSK
jgi:hypothetical protein